MNEKLKYLNIAFAIIFLKYALKLVSDLEFLIYNYFFVQIDFKYVVISIVLMSLVFAGVYRVYRYSVKTKSVIFAAGNLFFVLYFFFVGSNFHEYLIGRDSNYYGGLLGANEYKITLYFIPFLLIAISLYAIVVFLKSDKNNKDDKTLDNIV